MRIGKRIAVVTAGAGAVLAVAGGVAAAAGGDEKAGGSTRPGTVSVDESALPENDAAEQQKLAELAAVDMTHAAEAAVRSVHGGKAVEAELEADDGSVVWTVEVLGADGSLHEAVVDAGDAHILKTETETEDDARQKDTNQQNGAEEDHQDDD
ncbi:hypothetical protein DQ238_18315 [Geodermatophilus sp. TF02-6]|uniref:PepSY domain-containing protein n=1 Tax=Geodermatophilus sp. TF02-6 TaxID=2250575 RepID=UPI000DE99851|nr:PepSY domain-containing protein [Geodermatophilus sp. TF02-6]RBY76109.1 hypothetical protein DQ238_18315 [Geodermatophilus sp. TF02-6]